MNNTPPSPILLSPFDWAILVCAAIIVFALLGFLFRALAAYFNRAWNNLLERVSKISEEIAGVKEELRRELTRIEGVMVSQYVRRHDFDREIDDIRERVSWGRRATDRCGNSDDCGYIHELEERLRRKQGES